ncbi:hypothetical protein A3711_02840 [Erythrobacter sp. HI00D59]|nr:hypothetical protein A3711_02840 [Erythrobacter sp. HI00D59]
MRSPRVFTASPATLIVVALLGASFGFGAGGAPSPLGEGSVVILSAILAAFAIWAAIPATRPALPAMLVIVALPAIAAIQLIPWPTSLWAAFPFHDALASSLDTAGKADTWRPISIDPASTMWSLLCFTPPLLAFFLASSSNDRDIRVILICLLMLAAASAFLQMLQQFGGESFYLHPRSIRAGPSGFFANQNTQADLMLIALMTIILLSKDRSEGVAFPAAAALGGIVLFATSTVLTGSRTGVALLPLAMLFPLAFGASLGNRKIGTRALALPIGFAAIVFVALQFGRVSEVADRFSNLTDGRIERIWPDSIYLLQHSWPWGTGMGTFRWGFELVERLDVVDPTYANRAHSDWLEFLIEGGLTGACVIAGGLAIAAMAVRRHLQTRFDLGAKFALGALLVIALHSLVDYPVRTIPMSVLAGVAWGWFAGRRVKKEKR